MYVDGDTEFTACFGVFDLAVVAVVVVMLCRQFNGWKSLAVLMASSFILGSYNCESLSRLDYDCEGYCISQVRILQIELHHYF